MTKQNPAKINKTKSLKNRNKNRLKSDGLFKTVMANETAAREFLEEYLPANFKAMIDLSQIKVEKESYVEYEFKT